MAAFVSNTTGAASRSVTVPAGTDRLLVAVAEYSSSNAAQSATYGGVAMSVASTANGFVQIFYMLNPPVGSATLAVTGTSVDTVVAAHYTGVGSFQSGQQASAASASFSPNAGGLIVFGMEASSTSHTPLAGTNERVDSAGTYYADRIVTGSGAVTVGVSTATSPDYAGAIFLDSVNASGTPTAPSPSGSGSATPGTGASGTPTAPVATASGSADVIVSASGTPTAPHPTGAGTPAVVVSASGAATAPHPTASGSESLAPVSVSGALTVPAPGALGSAVRLGGIQCDHPRPKLDLPGYTPPRLAWQPPAYLPPSLEGLQRAVKEGFQGIYNELMKAAARRNIVPLIDDINAREGQVITGVGDGQTILMPPATPGQLGQVSVILTDVISPVTVVNPDGSTLTLDQPGTYPISTGPGENAWQPAPGVSSSGSAAGAGVVLGAAHASFPNGRVATSSAEIAVSTAVVNVMTWALVTGSVALSKLANLTGLSLLGRAANSAGVMAAITATGGGQYFRSNAAGTALEVADPASTSIVNTSGQLQRAALSGDVTAAQNGNATTIAAHAVTLGKMAQVTAPAVLGLQIGATSPGDVAALTGAEVGEIVRFAHQFSDTASSGSVTNYSLPDGFTGSTFNPPSDLTLHGISSGTLNSGRVFFFAMDRTATSKVRIKHESGTQTTANRRFVCPGLVDLDLYAGDLAIIFHDPNQDRYCVCVVQGPGRMVAFTKYTSGSGTHTFNLAAKSYIAWVQGAGGQGGGISVTGSVAGASGGGQAGEFVVTNNAISATTASYTVGAASSNAAGSAGADGGSSTFDSATAAGGKGAPLCTATAAAGVSDGGGDTATDRGAPGGYGWWDATGASSRQVPGIGGSCPMGQGAWRESNLGTGSAAGAGARGPFGGGGSGARTNATAGNLQGGPAKGGCILVWEYT